MAPRAVLIGLPGSGKSTIGRRLAKAMKLELLDTDAKIVEIDGRSIPEIFAADGEAGFRRIEERVIREALQAHDGILSLGGGAITTPGVREALAGHTVVFLEISVAEGIRRTTVNTSRPLLAGEDAAEKYRRLAAERGPLYRKAATVRISTNRRNPGAVVRQLMSRLDNPAPARSGRRRRRPPWRFTPPKAGAAGESTPPTPATPAALAARRREEAKK
ncbi:shikimate kinase [Mycolicibacterium fallax]|uniref:Shikimate kinase n=1 Tax=Mycolicibacterium fallax TaxID=1793 RepID=A0A1X1RH85_MYCFA|nr:shikimate kinase [Mycolicibacterium fallax]ORV06194.1 shikimate kinase [Mycolicibacterium fallax]BBY97097.1 shikimate kinase [Mycolicibacterium fallax]